MTCQQLVELVTEYFEGTLDEQTRREFDSHLGVCPGCDRYLEQLRITMRSAAEARELERTPEVRGLLDAFRDWRSARSSG